MWPCIWLWETRISLTVQMTTSPAAAVLVVRLLLSVLQLSGKGFLHPISTCSESPCTLRPRLHPCPKTKDCMYTHVMRLPRSPTPPSYSFQLWKTLGKRTLSHKLKVMILFLSVFILKKLTFNMVFVLVLFPPGKGVWLKARKVVPDSSHTKTMLWDSPWMLSCSREWQARCFGSL